MKSLRLKFIIPISSIILISLIAAVLVLANISGSLLSENSEREMDSKVVALSNVLNHYFMDRKVDIECWSQIVLFQEFTLAANDQELYKSVNEQLSVFDNTYDVYQSVNILDLNGDVIASSAAGKGKIDRIATGGKVVNLRERDYFQGAQQGKSVIGKTIFSKVTNSPVLCISAPITVDGRVTGVLYAAVDLSIFSKTFVEPVTMGKSGYAYVINEDGLFVAHPTDSLILSEEAVKKFDFLKTILQKRDGFLNYTWNGEKKTVSFHEIPETGWIAAVGVIDREIYAATTMLRITGLLILLISVVISIVLTKVLIDRTLVGIHSVTEASTKLSLGDLTHEISFTNNDEIGVMAEAFRTMQQNLTHKATLAQRVADGDLTGDLSIASDVDTLGISLKKMVEKKSSVLRSIQNVAASVDSGANQVSMLSRELSDGSVKSAAAIEEISVSMTSIGKQSDANARTAQDVSKVMSETCETIHTTSTDMNRLDTAMDKINSSSEEIGKIIKVIDDIAFQTNLLALNAAVEAARAGVHGKGFAVVADEVRNLASRSAKAAQETASLIDSAIENARYGREITNDTRNVFSQVEQSVLDVSERVDKITEASIEQSQGIEQIVAGIQQIEEVIHSNSASSEETAAASQELSSLAEELKLQVSRFKVRETMYSDIQAPQRLLS